MGLPKVLRHPGRAARLATVFFQAAMDSHFRTVSTSNTALLGLRLRDKFNAESFYPELLRHGQFVFFGDSNHTDRSLHTFFYSRENIERMAAAGIRHIFPEIEPRFQPLVDLVANGQVTPDDFALLAAAQSAKDLGISLNELARRKTFEDSLAGLRERGAGFRMMAEKGMKIHCLDDRKNLDSSSLRDIFKFMAEARNFIVGRNGLPGILHGKAYMRFVIENAKKLQGMNLADMPKLLAMRGADDPALAERMKQAAGNERAAILFGKGHATMPDSLFDCLGRDRTVRVDLYSNRDLYADRLFRSTEQKIQPDFVHIIGEHTLFRFRGFKDLTPEHS
jgi:hypothetical protein